MMYAKNLLLRCSGCLRLRSIIVNNFRLSWSAFSAPHPSGEQEDSGRGRCSDWSTAVRGGCVGLHQQVLDRSFADEGRRRRY